MSQARQPRPWPSAKARTLGYQLFRLLDGAPMLVPLDPRLPLDPFELNLFACKPDQIRSLREENFLVDQLLTWEPNSEAISGGLSLLRQQEFAPMFGHLLDDAKYIDCDYAEALAAFAVWRTNDLPAHIRCAALFLRIAPWKPYAIVHLLLPAIQHSRV